MIYTVNWEISFESITIQIVSTLQGGVIFPNNAMHYSYKLETTSVGWEGRSLLPEIIVMIFVDFSASNSEWYTQQSAGDWCQGRSSCGIMFVLYYMTLTFYAKTHCYDNHMIYWKLTHSLMMMMMSLFTGASHFQLRWLRTCGQIDTKPFYGIIMI